MEKDIHIVRAVATEFISRKWKSICIPVAVIAVALLGVSIYLAVSYTAWWLLLTAIVVLWSTIAALIALVILFGIRSLRPKLTPLQATVTNKFVDKLERIAEKVQTPMFIILFYVVKDTLKPSKDPYILGFANDTNSLKSDYADLRSKFS